MDAIILAAGKNARLSSVVAPYHKPFVKLGGRTLFNRLVSDINEFFSPEHIIIVAAPQNTATVIEELQYFRDTSTTYVLEVQDEPTGPGDALLLGLLQASSEATLCVMGDNYITPRDWSRFSGAESALRNFNLVGVRTMQYPDASRMTIVDRRTQRVWEKVPELTLPNDIGPYYTVWCGPLALRTETAIATLNVFKHKYPGVEVPIGPLIPTMGPWGIVNLKDTVDIGDPKTLAEVMEKTK